jgi:DNA-binding SARP family transcriptional activator
VDIKTSEDPLKFKDDGEKERWVTILKALRSNDFEVLEQFASESSLKQSDVTTYEIKEQLFNMAPGTRPIFKLILRDYLNRIRGMGDLSAGCFIGPPSTPSSSSS